MIRVRIWRHHDRPVRYRISGHAGAAPHGKDIVCAAVSALAQTALIGLEDHLGLKPKVVLDDDEGLLDVSLPDVSSDSRLEQGSTDIIETMMLGLTSMAQSYPDYIEIEQIFK